MEEGPQHGKKDRKGPVQRVVCLTSALMGMGLYEAGSDSVTGQRRSETSDVRFCPRRNAAIFPPDKTGMVTLHVRTA